MSEKKMYEAPHLKLKTGEISPFVIVVGDPFRTELVAKMCDTHKEVAWNREYRTFNCVYKNVEISVISHGIGGPGAAICFEEAIKLGAKVIVRLGTCGSLKPEVIKQGNLLVSIAATREDGHTGYYAPSNFPAVADPEIALLLKEHATKLDGAKVFMGITHTSAVFYPGPCTGDNLKMNADAGCLGVEMENSTLFTIASIRGIRAGSCAVVDGSPFKWEDGDYDPHGTHVNEAKKLMFLAGLETLVSLANN
jgi:uridine phosphorylase